MNYHVFHEESKGDKNAEYWHAFYWVPESIIDELYGFLRLALERSEYQGNDYSFKRLGKRQSAHRYARCWLTILQASLHQQKFGHRVACDVGRIRARGTYARVPDYRRFSCIPACKLNVFFLPEGLNALAYCKDSTQQFETTFRMGIKGGAHWLFSPEKPCSIANIWLDRERHYARPLNKQQIIERLRRETRDYVSLAEHCHIEGENVPLPQRLILDALDIMLGAIRHAYAHGNSQESLAKAQKRKLTLIPHDLMQRLNRGDSMRNSRFFNGYTFSQARLRDGEWEYAPLHNDVLDRLRPKSGHLEFDL